jgi:regulator of cell morphogenesis and NO signaling
MPTLLSSNTALQKSNWNLYTQTDNANKQIYLSAEKWPLPYLVDYILQNHHFYITDALPRIMGLLEKVVTEYGLAHPELEGVYQVFHSLAMNLITQMRKEEIILFPYIQVLAKHKDHANESDCCSVSTLIALLQEIEEEHLSIEHSLTEIRSLTQNFTVPPQVCTSYNLLFCWLEQFEKDIYQHEYLENNILFPKVLCLKEAIGLKI